MDFYVQKKKEEDKEEEPNYAERLQKRLREEDRAKRGDESSREKLFEKFANSILKVNEEIKPAKKMRPAPTTIPAKPIPSTASQKKLFRPCPLRAC
jgi:ATPase subunit of ABC transporter with duplicated ATPase domains